MERSNSRTFQVLACLFCLLAAGCAQDKERVLARVTLENPAGLERNEEVVEIPFAPLAARLNGKDFRVTTAGEGENVPFQLEYRGGEQPLHLLVQVSLAPGGKLDLEIREGKSDSLPSRTFARYVPERLDDFAWENDKVAFRMYGKALEGTSGDAHGIDVWVKRTPELVIDKWYKSGDYHEDHGEGLDYYSVGLTLGAGDIAPYLNDSLYFSRHYRGHKVLDNGPLRTTFRLDYEEWDAGGLPVKVSKLISLDAGAQLNRIEARYEMEGRDSLPVAVGIVQRKDPGELLQNQEKGILGYWEPPHASYGTTGLGCVFPAPLNEVRVAHGHLLGIATALPQKPLVYYNGAAWDKAGEFRDASAWFAYLSAFREKLGHQIIVHTASE